MNLNKIDTSLASALRDIEDPEEATLAVFIHTTVPLKPDQRAFLQRSGINIGTEDRRVLTGTFSASKISELSDEPWVLYIKLSEKLRMVKASGVSHGLKRGL